MASSSDNTSDNTFSGGAETFLRTRGAWAGGLYELNLAFTPASDERAEAANAALRAHRTLEDWPEHWHVGPDEQARRNAFGGWIGVAQLPNGSRVPCQLIWLREEAEVGADWMFFGVPIASLGQTYPVGAFPFADGTSLAWRDEIDAWLIDLATHVFAAAPFRLGLVGWVDSGSIDVEEMRRGSVPDIRWEGYLWPENGTVHWFPPNQGAPFSF